MLLKVFAIFCLLFVSFADASVTTTRWRRRDTKGSKSILRSAKGVAVPLQKILNKHGENHFKQRKRMKMRHRSQHDKKGKAMVVSKKSYQNQWEKRASQSHSGKSSMPKKMKGKSGQMHHLKMKRKWIRVHPMPSVAPTVIIPPELEKPDSPSPTQSPVFTPSPSSLLVTTPSPTSAREKYDNPVMLASSPNGGLYSMFQFCGGSLISGTFPENVIEVVYDRATDRSWAQHGRETFEMFEFDPLTGDEIPESRFSTDGVNQFHALEYIDGVLYGGGWTREGPDPQSTLYIIDVDGKNWTEVGPSNVGRLTGLAWTGTTLYGVSGAVGPTSQLYEIDLATGVGTVLCEYLTAVFGSLVYFQNKIYGGTSDGNVAEIIPGTCEVLNIDTGSAWTAGFRPVTGLSVVCE